MSPRVLLVIVILFLFHNLPQAKAQNADLFQQDLSAVSASQVSDQQLRRLINYAETQNLTEQQIEAGLISRNMPAAEAAKIISRFRELRSGAGTDNNQDQTNITEDSLDGQLSEKDTAATRLSEEEKRVFGSELFSSENLTFEPSLDIATPENYQVGPGDELRVNIWGASRQTYNLEVSRDGNVVIDNLGPIYVNGLSIDQAEKRIVGRLTEIYSGLRATRERPANTFAEVTLGQVRSIKVTIVGEVQKPGTYTLPSVATAFNALYLSGGPTFIGSFRNVEVIRNNDIVAQIDVYGYLVGGRKTQNIILKDQDIIRVVPYQHRIELEGQIKRPGYYEMKESESLADAIRFGGGFTDKAYTHRIKVTRNTSRQKRIEDVPETHLNDFTPKNGDIVYVDSILNRYANKIEIHGAVFRPGEYALEDSTTLLSLIKRAEGLREDAFKNRVLIYRKNDNLFDKVLSADLQKIANGSAADIPLQREDVVRVLSIKELEEEFSIEISGEVQDPGQFPFMYNMTLEDLIAIAGGLKESASRARVEVARRVKATNVQDSLSDLETMKTAEIFQFNINKNLSINPDVAQFTLQPFDQVFIRRSPGYEEQRIVYVKGEVRYPGKYALENKDERISDLIKRAGGLTAYAYPDGAALIRLNPAYFEEKLEKEEILRDSLKTVMSQRNFSGNINYQELRPVNIDDDDQFDNSLFAERPVETEDVVLADVNVPSYKISESKTQSIGIELEKILSRPESRYDIRLLAGDTLEIPKELETVRMSGELLYPISSRYDKRKTFRNYISEAGGFTKDADRKRAYIIYANGSVDRTRSILFVKDYPEVKPGAEIIVPEKQRRPFLSPQAWIGIGTGLTTLTLAVLNIVNRF